MDSRAAIIASCWFAIAIVSAMFIFVGGVNLGTGIAVALLILIAAGVTFGVGFGLEEMRQHGPLSRTQAQISGELTEMKAAIGELTKKVEVIQRELEQ